MQMRRLTALLMVVGLIVSACGGSATATFDLVSAPEAHALIADPPEGLVVLDVRTPDEFAGPRLSDAVTVAQLQDRFDFALNVRDRVSVANEAVINIREIKVQVDDRLELTETQEIHTVGGEVKVKLSDVEQEIYQVRNEARQDPLNYPVKLNNKLASLIGLLEAAEAEPTESSREVYRYLSTLLQEELDRMDIIIEQDLGRLNELLRGEDLPPINPDPIISDR